MIIGYARVSTTVQDTRLQLDALARAGVETVYQEKISGAAAKRPELERMLSALQPGDIVKVYKIDRLARSMLHLLSIIQRIESAGAAFMSLTESVDTSSAAGRMLIQMLGAFAEYERSLIRERSIAGQVAAYQRGVRWGGKESRLPKEHWDEVRACYASGWWTMKTLGDWFGVSRRTIEWVIYPERTRKGKTDALPVLGTYLSQQTALE